MILQEEEEESNQSLLQETTSHDVEVVSFTVENPDSYYEDVQLEESAFSPPVMNEIEELVVQNENLLNTEKKISNRQEFKLVVGFSRSLRFAIEIMLFIILRASRLTKNFNSYMEL